MIPLPFMPRYGVLLLLGLTTRSFVGGWHLMAKPTRPRRLVEVIFFFQLVSCCFLGCLFWLLAEFTKFLHQLCDEAASIVKHKLQSFVFCSFFGFHFWLAGCFQAQVHKSLNFASQRVFSSWNHRPLHHQVPTPSRRGTASARSGSGGRRHGGLPMAAGAVTCPLV